MIMMVMVAMVLVSVMMVEVTMVFVAMVAVVVEVAMVLVAMVVMVVEVMAIEVEVETRWRVCSPHYEGVASLLLIATINHNSATMHCAMCTLFTF